MRLPTPTAATYVVPEPPPSDRDTLNWSGNNFGLTVQGRENGVRITPFRLTASYLSSNDLAATFTHGGCTTSGCFSTPTERLVCLKIHGTYRNRRFTAVLTNYDHAGGRPSGFNTTVPLGLNTYGSYNQCWSTEATTPY